MSTPSRSRTVTLRDGARVTLRPISPGDKPLLTAAFERLSEESRYRRFFTIRSELSAAELDYLVDVDHRDHEAIVAIDPCGGEVLGVARYIRLPGEGEIAEVAVTVVDDWQRRGLGRALLARLTYRARQEGVRRFSALVQSDNQASLELLAGIGNTSGEFDTGEVRLVIELPASRGTGARLVETLRAAAAGGLDPARTLAHRVSAGTGTWPRPPSQRGRPIQTIVVGADDSRTPTEAVDVAVRLAAILGAQLHVVRTYRALKASPEADAALEAATRAARAEGMRAVTHARRGSPAAALIAVAVEQHADLLVVDSTGMGRASRFLSSGVPDRVSHHPPCSILIVRADKSQLDPTSG